MCRLLIVIFPGEVIFVTSRNRGNQSALTYCRFLFVISNPHITGTQSQYGLGKNTFNKENANKKNGPALGASPLIPPTLVWEQEGIY